MATSHPDYTTDAQKRDLLGLWTDGVRPRPCGSAGLEYLAVARGELDATAFSWEAAWDHAAGLLLVEEAGGTHLTKAGEPFRITGGTHCRSRRPGTRPPPGAWWTCSAASDPAAGRLAGARAHDLRRPSAHPRAARPGSPRAPALSALRHILSASGLG